MAKRPVSTHIDSSKGRVRVVFIEMEAKDSTIEESIRAVTSAITGSSTFGHSRLIATTTHRSTTLSSGTSSQDADSNEELSTDSEAADAANVATEAVEDNSSKSKPRKAPKSPELLDVEVPEGKERIIEYVARHNPQTQLQRCLACVGWWTDVMGVDQVGPDHLYTAFRMLSRKDGPKDYRVPLSDLERKTPWTALVKAGRGCWKLNHIGRQHLDKMLEPASSS